MPSEYAASFPRDAEASLASMKRHYSRFLKGNRDIKDKDIWIEVLDKTEYGLITWEIQISESLRDEIKERKEELISDLSPSGQRIAKELMERRKEVYSLQFEYIDPHWERLEVGFVDWGYPADYHKVGRCFRRDKKILRMIFD